MRGKGNAMKDTPSITRHTELDDTLAQFIKPPTPTTKTPTQQTTDRYRRISKKRTESLAENRDL